MKMSVERRWNGTDRENRSTGKENLSQCRFNTNLTRTVLLSNPVLHNEMTVINRLKQEK
jgi:hypothetical protein